VNSVSFNNSSDLRTVHMIKLTEAREITPYTNGLGF
jgi:hypothetical protein